MTNRCGALSTFLKRVKNIKRSPDHTLFYRGHSDSSYQDVPSIYRADKNNKENFTYISEEHSLFRKIIMACPSEFISCKSAFDHLVKMQHYNMPTRLLDITSNPLVALYMACKNHNGRGGKEGEVIVYEVPTKDIKFYSSDQVSVMSNISKRPNDLVVSELKKLSHEDLIKNTSYLRLMHEIQEEKPYFLSKIKLKHLESVVCVQPKLENQRLIKQSGAFLLFGISENKLEPAKIKKESYKFDESGKRIKLLITINGKNKILSDLKELAISEATLFPEIEKVSSYLKSQLELKNKLTKTST